MPGSNNTYKIISPGVLAPLLFVVTFTIDGLLRDNYSSMKNFISELSIGNGGWIQIANFMVLGFLFFIFSLDVFKKFRKRGLSLTGPKIFLIIAVAYFFSGPFVTDPGTIFTQQKSVHGIIHGILGALVFTLMPISCWVFLKQFKRQPDYRSLKIPTYFFAILITIAVIFLTFITKVPAYRSSLVNLYGFIQRLALIPFMIWLCYFAIVFRKSNANENF